MIHHGVAAVEGLLDFGTVLDFGAVIVFVTVIVADGDWIVVEGPREGREVVLDCRGEQGPFVTMCGVSLAS
jgi:hypothetical protein